MLLLQTEIVSVLYSMLYYVHFTQHFTVVTVSLPAFVSVIEAEDMLQICATLSLSASNRIERDFGIMLKTIDNTGVYCNISSYQTLEPHGIILQPRTSHQ